MIETIKRDGIYILKRLSVIGLTFWCMYLIYVWFHFGFWWFFLGLFLTGVGLSIAMRHHLMLAIRTIEMSLWGKPLDKQYWQEEKPPKLKFVWKRNRDNDD